MRSVVVNRIDPYTFRITFTKQIRKYILFGTKSPFSWSYQGGGTVWYAYPSGVRCGTGKEIELGNVLKHWEFNSCRVIMKAVVRGR